MRKALLNLDREAVFVANLYGGVLQRGDDQWSLTITHQRNPIKNTKIIKVRLASNNLERDEEAKLASGFWELLSNVFHLVKPMIRQ